MSSPHRKTPVGMSWEAITPPAYELLTTTEARRHLRLESYGGEEDAAEDEYLTSLIAAAGDTIEQHTRRPIRAQQRRLLVRVGNEGLYEKGSFWWHYHWYGEIRLNATPIRSVDSVSYVDDGRWVVVDAADYVVVGAVGGIHNSVSVCPAVPKWWPWGFRSPDIRVDVSCGYLQESLPAQVKHAARIMVGDFYSHRSEVVVGASVAKVPRSVNALLAPFCRNVF